MSLHELDCREAVFAEAGCCAAVFALRASSFLLWSTFCAVCFVGSARRLPDGRSELDWPLFGAAAATAGPRPMRVLMQQLLVAVRPSGERVLTTACPLTKTVLVLPLQVHVPGAQPGQCETPVPFEKRSAG
jgi:hypothetical protein